MLLKCPLFNIMKFKVFAFLLFLLIISQSWAQTLIISDDFYKQALEYVSVIAPQFEFIGLFRC